MDTKPPTSRLQELNNIKMRRRLQLNSDDDVQLIDIMTDIVKDLRKLRDANIKFNQRLQKLEES